MIVTGILIANLIALYIAKKSNTDHNDFIILECYGVLGGFLGAKILYLLTVLKYIDFSRIFEKEYFLSLMQGGFVFYGGLIGGLAVVLCAGRFQKIETVKYIRTYICLLPLIHGFGRIGCFMAGCCYGVPYHGKISVVFPENSFAPAGVELFPVQLVEACLLIALSILLIFLQVRFEFKYNLELYLLIYAIIRFVLENYRYDAVRGRFLMFSTSQWISIGLMIFALCSLYGMNVKQKKQN